MALIACPECGRQVSDKAPLCPHCGMPNAAEAPPPASAPPGGQSVISSEERKAGLDQSVASCMRQPGSWRVETQGDFYAIVASGQPVNHLLHLLLTVFTVGLWALVWYYLAVTSGSVTRVRLAVDEYGNWTTEHLG
jgi:hypothetical protein